MRGLLCAESNIVIALSVRSYAGHHIVKGDLFITPCAGQNGIPRAGGCSFETFYLHHNPMDYPVGYTPTPTRKSNVENRGD